MQRLERGENSERPIAARNEEKSIEEDLRSLNALAPELMVALPGLFKNAIMDSIRSGMDGRDFGMVLKSLPGLSLEHRPYVFRFLDSVYGEKSKDLEQAIDRRFQFEVRHLILKATSNASDQFQTVHASI